MIKSNKTYIVGENEIKCEIVYGFDPELLINFTNDENNALYMFIPRDEYDEEWFKKNENKNFNIGVYVIDRLLDDENQFSKLENVIQKMYKLQDDAYKSINK